MLGTYRQTCPVTFGSGALRLISKIAQELHLSKVLLLADIAMVEQGIAAEIINDLAQNQVEYVLYSGVRGEASDAGVELVGKMAKDEKVDGIMAVGGGSVMDTAKAAALYAANDLTVAELFTLEPFSLRALPTILVPTTFGTGSESTAVAVVLDSQSKKKSGIFSPGSYALIDPNLSLNLPRKLTVYTALDAFSHALEAYTSCGCNPHSDLLAEDAMARLWQYLPLAAADGQNIKARSEVALASNFAGIAFNEAGVHFGHAIAHSLGAIYKLHHGHACALTLPLVLRKMAPYYPEKMQRLAQIAAVDLFAAEPQDYGEKLAEAVSGYMHELGVQSLHDLGYDIEQLSQCIDYILSDDLRNNSPLKVEDRGVVQEMLEDMLSYT